MTFVRERIDKRHAEKRRCIDEIKANSTWWKSKKRYTADVEELTERIADKTQIKRRTVRAVLMAAFGNDKSGTIGELPAMLMEGRNVDCTPFGIFHHRMTKPRVTNDVSQPGTMTYTPANSTIVFKPTRNTTYWPNFEASMRANMPKKPLPQNMHFSQRIQGMSWYQDWKKEMEELCEPSGEAEGTEAEKGSEE